MQNTVASSSAKPQARPGAQASVASIRPWAVVLAAGAGTRMAAAAGCAKQFIEYEGAPLYWHSALTFSRLPAVAGLIFVFPAHCLADETVRLRTLDAGSTLGLPWQAVAGGELRQDSVHKALVALPPSCNHVLIHDAARPFASAALMSRVCEALAEGVGVIPFMAVTDTIKVVEDHKVTLTLDRAKLAAIQTPQGFDLTVLRAAHAKAAAEKWTVTDDAALLERCGHTVMVVQGEANNIKLTNPEDMHMLQAPQKMPLPCSGFGYDVHRFASPAGTGRPLKLGGVPMNGGMEVMAHSDGDVLLHALMDAILGCACAGDIGQHFPDSSPAFDNADSAVLLDNVLRIAAEAGVTLVQVDLTIITQKPKISPQRTAIQSSVAHLLNLPSTRVNVKATTEEGLGFTGACQGIKAVALVTGLRAHS